MRPGATPFVRRADIGVARRRSGPGVALVMSALGVRRDKAALSSGCKPHLATAPAGSRQKRTCISRRSAGAFKQTVVASRRSKVDWRAAAQSREALRSSSLQRLALMAWRLCRSLDGVELDLCYSHSWKSSRELHGHFRHCRLYHEKLIPRTLRH